MARPIDVEITTRPHAILSASSADRWLTCTPSARIEELIPDQTSEFAAEGTAAHAFAETRLRFLLKQISKEEYLVAYEATKTLYAEATESWTLAEWNAIDDYVNYVLSEVERLEGDALIEQRVDYSKYAESGFGTSDVIIVSRKTKTIKSIDLKFGKGVVVSAYNNSQARLYALGALLGFDPDGTIENIEWAIVQPRLDYVGEGSEPVTSLLKWAEEVVRPKALMAWKGEGKLVTSEKGCRFCKVKATCRARVAENVLIAQRDFATMPDIRIEDVTLEMSEVAKILPQLDGWISWANALKDYALKQVRDNGAEIEGYKLVRGRSNRGWMQGVDVIEELKKAGAPDSDFMSDPIPPQLKSVAQVEKSLGKAKFSAVAPVIVNKPLGSPTLVPVEDPRPPINAAEEAANEFGIK